MKSVDEFVPLLGLRMRRGSDELLRLAQRWGVAFPEDMVHVSLRTAIAGSPVTCASTARQR